MANKGRPKGTKNKWGSRKSVSLSSRFWEKVEIGDEKECWEWKAFVHPSGYGMFAINRKMYGSHRIAWELTKGAIPGGMCVCHRCDNRKCVNPTHLFLGTYQDNMNDRENKHRGKVPNNRGENHGMHKLTVEKVREIRKMAAKGVSYKEISGRFGVVHQTISKVVSRQSWGWLE